MDFCMFTRGLTDWCFFEALARALLGPGLAENAGTPREQGCSASGWICNWIIRKTCESLEFQG